MIEEAGFTENRIVCLFDPTVSGAKRVCLSISVEKQVRE